LSLLLLAVCGPAWGQFNVPPTPGQSGTPSQQPPLLEGVRIDQRLDNQVPPDAVFRDEAGREVRLGEFFGKRPVVLALVYFRCPKLCTLVVNGLTEAMKPLQLEVGRDFEVVTISFDPLDKPDTAAAKKKNYLELYGRPQAGAGWHFLTGTEPQIKRVTEAVGYHYRYDPVSQQYVHPAGIAILTPEGRIARYLLGIEYQPRDLRLALVEASQRKIGTPVDAVLLYCFHYDESTGKYTANVMSMVRAGGVLSISVAVGFFALMWWRSRHPARSPSQPG
jgi:protein SCO1/2